MYIYKYIYIYIYIYLYTFIYIRESLAGVTQWYWPALNLEPCGPVAVTHCNPLQHTATHCIILQLKLEEMEEKTEEEEEGGKEGGGEMYGCLTLLDCMQMRLSSLYALISEPLLSSKEKNKLNSQTNNQSCAQIKLNLQHNIAYMCVNIYIYIYIYMYISIVYIYINVHK